LKPLVKTPEGVESKPRRITLASHKEAPSHLALGRIAASLADTLPKEALSNILHHLKLRRDWGQELAPQVKGYQSVFYPFAGVDIFSAAGLFPDAQSITMVALFPVGDCQASNWTDLPGRQAAVLGAMTGMFDKFGYFGTAEMQKNLVDTGYGTSLMLLASLQIMGLTPISMECGLAAKPDVLGIDHHDVLRIRFRSRHGESRELVYVRAHLTQPSPALSRFFKELGTLPKMLTMIKAAEYDIKRFGHEGRAANETFRVDARPLIKFILSASSAVMQDDTGIRIGCTSSWKKTFFGKYIGPSELLDLDTDRFEMFDVDLRAEMCNNQATFRNLPTRWGGYGPPWRDQVAPYDGSCPKLKRGAVCDRIDRTSGSDRRLIHGPATSNGFAMLLEKPLPQ